MPLSEHQWQLSYDAAGGHLGASYIFGDLATSQVWTLTPPKISSGEARTVDAEMPAEDGTAFGRDYRPGLTVAFEMAVDATADPDPRAVSADLFAALAEVWDARAVRSVPRAVAALTGHRAGRDRRVYGRPRRCEVANEEFAEFGHIQVVADFTAVDDTWYDDAEQSITVPLVPPSTSGILTPVEVPMSTTPATAKAGAVVIGGTRPAWPIITITAGSDVLSSPTVSATNRWALRLNTSIAPGTSVTIDSRPWARTVLGSDGGSFAGYIDNASPRLSKISLPPGAQELVLLGTDTSGTASMQVRWRNAWAGR